MMGPKAQISHIPQDWMIQGMKFGQGEQWSNSITKVKRWTRESLWETNRDSRQQCLTKANQNLLGSAYRQWVMLVLKSGQNFKMHIDLLFLYRTVHYCSITPCPLLFHTNAVLKVGQQMSPYLIVWNASKLNNSNIIALYWFSASESWFGFSALVFLATQFHSLTRFVSFWGLISKVLKRNHKPWSWAVHWAVQNFSDFCFNSNKTDTGKTGNNQRQYEHETWETWNFASFKISIVIRHNNRLFPIPVTDYLLQINTIVIVDWFSKSVRNLSICLNNHSLGDKRFLCQKYLPNPLDPFSTEGCLSSTL